MNSDATGVETVLLFPLILSEKIARQYFQPGMAVLIAFLILAGLWITALYRGRKAPHPARFLFVYLIAVICFPVAIFLNAACGTPQFLAIQFLIVIQTYFFLATLTVCECYWNRSPRPAWITAGLAMLTPFPVWLITGFCWALTRQ